MPFPLPWFNNKVDPLLPQDGNIKPALYYLDDYQTYDLLWIQGAANNPAPGFLPVGKFLIERFTPWNYAWCEEYSTKLFNFFKEYNFFQYAQALSSDTFSSRYQPKFLTTNLPCKIKLNFETSEPKPFVITWLEMNENEATKRYQLFQPIVGKNEFTILVKNLFCACSMVVSPKEVAIEIEQILDNIDAGLLYKNFDLLLNDARNNYKKEKYKIRIGRHFYNYYPQNIDSKKYMQIQEITIPNNFYYAALIYANNNHWGNPINIDITKDLGKPVLGVYQKNVETEEITGFEFKLWGNYNALITGNYGDSANRQGVVMFEGYGNFANPTGFDLSDGERYPRGSQLWLSIQTNLWKEIKPLRNVEDMSVFGFITVGKYWSFKIFDESEIEALSSPDIEYSLIAYRVMPPRDLLISYIDAEKKLQLEEDNA